MHAMLVNVLKCMHLLNESLTCDKVDQGKLTTVAIMWSWCFEHTSKRLVRGKTSALEGRAKKTSTSQTHYSS